MKIFILAASLMATLAAAKPDANAVAEAEILAGIHADSLIARDAMPEIFAMDGHKYKYKYCTEKSEIGNCDGQNNDKCCSMGKKCCNKENCDNPPCCFPNGCV